MNQKKCFWPQMSYHRNNMMKKKTVAKKLHCQFGHSSAEKNKTIVKIRLHIGSGIKQNKWYNRKGLCHA